MSDIAALQPAQPGPPAARRALWRRVLRNPVGLVSSVLLVAILAFGLLAPLLAPFEPNLTRLELTNAPPFSSDFPLGGDDAGRDILSRLMYATVGTAQASAVVLFVSVLIGVSTGLMAGYFGGRLDDVSDWVANVVLALPGFVLLIALYTVIGPNILMAMAVFGVLIAPSFFRLVRSLVQKIRHELYVDAARVSGLSDRRIVSRHILRAVRGPVIVHGSFVLTAGISIQAGLEFLGLGNPRDPSWGGMLQDAFNNIYANGLAVVWPAVLIAITTLCLVLLGNVVRDVLQTSASRPAALKPAVVRRLRTPQDVGVATRDDHPPGTPPLLRVRDLALGYPDSPSTVTPVVHGVGLTVERGEIHGLVGESGSGKSQVAFSILGILPPEAVILRGSIEFHGSDLLTERGAMRKARGRRIAYVPQEPMSNLDPTFTIGQQLSFGLRAVKDVSRRDAREQLIDLLGQVGIANPRTVFDLYPHQVSGGMAQRVLIAGALAGDPELIVADEPTTALDVTVQADVLELLRDLQRERDLGMVLVTHNFGVVADFCDRVSVMKEGRIVESKPVRELFEFPEHEYTRMLLASSLDGAQLRAPGGLCGVQAMTRTPAATVPGEPLLSVQNLDVSYPTAGFRSPPARILEGVSLDIAPHETLGLVGESGSGKTTLGRAILGLAPVTGGRITFEGQDLAVLSRKQRRRHAKDIQVVFQDPYSSLNPALTIEDILAEPLLANGVKAGRGTVRELLDKVHLPADAGSRLAREFSGGQRQRIAIARALALSPKLIICDEPTSALDLSTQAKVLNLLIEIQERTGVAYLFITHDLAVVRAISHRIAVMLRGEIVELGTAEQVTDAPQHPYTQRLHSAAPVADPVIQARRRHERQRLLERL